MVAFTLAELAARIGGEVVGDGSLSIAGVAPLETAGPDQLSFFANKKYRRAFEASRAGAVVVEPDAQVPDGRTVLRARNDYLGFANTTPISESRRRGSAGVSRPPTA
jgi:UDP-3-O-[3-hydroxymyristoyl] glucosamine N-acyltransferase